MKLIKVDNLNDNQKVYLAYKVFNYWNNGKIVNNKQAFLPSNMNISNINDIIKAYLICSRLSKDKEVDKILKHFDKLTFYEKLDFMIYLFDMINDIELIPNYINDDMSLKDLSNMILKYKLCL